MKSSFQLRARFAGNIEWLCPCCAFLNRSKIVRTSWQVRCGGPSCKHFFAVGMIFHAMDGLMHHGGRYAPPPDIAFPRAVLEQWKAGAAVHRLECNSDSE